MFSAATTPPWRVTRAVKPAETERAAEHIPHRESRVALPRDGQAIGRDGSAVSPQLTAIGSPRRIAPPSTTSA